MDSDSSTLSSLAVRPAPTAEKKTLDIFRSEKPPNLLSSLSLKEDACPRPTSETAVRTICGTKWFLVVLAIAMTAFLYGLDTSIAADVQGPVVEQFGDVEKLAWIGDGFPLGSLTILVLISSLLNNFNVKWVFIASVVIFEIGSAICGAANNMDTLIFGRVLAGVGGAGLYLSAINIFSALTIPNERGFYISLTAFAWGLGAVVGPAVGGAFAESSATWRWAFYINLVIGAAISPVLLLMVPDIYPVQGKSIRERILGFDLLGLILVGASFLLFALAFTLGGTTWSWNDGRSTALVAIFCILLLITVIQQGFAIFTTKSARAIPCHLLLDRTQLLVLTCNAASNAALLVTIYYIPIYFQFVDGDGPIQAAFRLMPYVIVCITINLLAGKFLSRIQYYMPIFLVGGLLIAIPGALMIVYLNPATPQRVIYGLTILIGVGTGLTLQLGYAIATLTVPASEMGNALSVQNMAQVSGGVVCLVITGQVFQSTAVRHLTVALQGHGFTAKEIASVAAGAQSKFYHSLSPPLKESATRAVVRAMQSSFVLVLTSGAVMMLAAVHMKRERLFGEKASSEEETVKRD